MTRPEPFWTPMDDDDNDDDESFQTTCFFHHQGWRIKYALLPAVDLPDPSITVRQTVVFVHGTPWSSDIFQPLTEALLARRPYPILLYDLPGYGDSQEIESQGQQDEGLLSKDTIRGDDFVGDTSIRAQAVAFAALLEHVGLDGKNGNPKPAVIAHDIGGVIALRAHLAHGCEFRSVMLMSANLLQPWEDNFFTLVRSDPRIFLQMPPNIFEAVVRAVVQSSCFNPNVLRSGLEDSLMQPWFANGGRMGQRNFVRQIVQASDGDMIDRHVYGKIRCPVNVLAGEEDQRNSQQAIEDSARAVGSSLKGFVVVPDAGHLIMLDQPSRVAIEVFDWLS